MICVLVIVWDAMLSRGGPGAAATSKMECFVIIDNGSKRYSKANKKYLTSNYPKKPTNYITSSDKNDL